MSSSFPIAGAGCYGWPAPSSPYSWRTTGSPTKFIRLCSRRAQLSDLARRHFSGKLPVTAQRIRQLHLPRRAALRLEKQWTAHENHRGLRSRSGHVQPVEAVEKFHPARRVLRRRRRERINHHSGFLSLKFVHRSNLDSRKPRREVRNLSVVGSDDQNFVLAHSAPVPRAVEPAHLGP